MTSKSWCFTVNNPTESDKTTLDGLLCGYIVYGLEKGDSGTTHYQGYVEFEDKVRLATARNRLGGRAHVEPRRGTQEQAITYCKKDGSHSERGTPYIRGARTDLDRVRESALEGGMRDVSSWANLQGIRVAEKFLSYNEEARNWKMEVTWLCGVTGVGKSMTARKMLGEDCFTKSEGSKWWDSYDGHTDVIIDDFRDSWWSLTYMLRLLDRYECLLEVKGGMRQFRAKRVIVTSICHPAGMYAGTGEDIKQLLRRIDNVFECVSDVAEVAGVILEPRNSHKSFMD